MADFLTGKKLGEEVYDIIFNARETLLIVSPYIKLDDYFKKEVFNKHKANSDLHIIIAFGKNIKNPEKSFKQEDIDYFKEFPNITIVYVPNLHAKYYANEDKGIVTSMNLYDYSFKNNIEYGVISRSKLIGGSGIEYEAMEQTMHMLKSNYTVFVRRPKYKKKYLGLVKECVGHDNVLDLTQELLYNNLSSKKNIYDYLDDSYIDEDHQKERITRSEFERTKSNIKIDIQSKTETVIYKGKLVSATVLGKKKEMSYKQVIEAMSTKGFIEKDEITEVGHQVGLNYKSNTKGDKWIVYPETLSKEL